MKSIYSILRSSLLVVVAIAGLVWSLTIMEMGFFFGAALLVGAALTGIYLFLHFDEQVNEKVIMEPLMDAFAGLVLLTYPEISQRFVLADLAFWLAMNGILYLASGAFNHPKSSKFWLYMLAGLVFIIFGFTLINYNQDFISSVNYLLAFSIFIYGGISLYLSVVRKKNPLQP